MSYILEALRRSQAERERGRVPGLDAQPLPADPASGPRRGLPIVWVSSGLGVLLLLVGVLVATWWVRPQARGPQAALDTPPATALPSPRAAAPAPQPAPPPTQVPAPAPAPTQAAAPVAPSPLPQVVSVPQPARPAATPAPGLTAEPAAPQAAPAQAQPQPQPTPPPAARALTMSQLSAEQRRELPPMVIGGSVWSDNAASRFVIVNGQVIREGETAAPGVTLERIAPKAATLRWRDLRIEMPL